MEPGQYPRACELMGARFAADAAYRLDHKDSLLVIPTAAVWTPGRRPFFCANVRRPGALWPARRPASEASPLIVELGLKEADVHLQRCRRSAGPLSRPPPRLDILMPYLPVTKVYFGSAVRRRQVSARLTAPPYGVECIRGPFLAEPAPPHAGGGSFSQSDGGSAV